METNISSFSYKEFLEETPEYKAILDLRYSPSAIALVCANMKIFPTVKFKLKGKILECSSQTITVGGIPSDFTRLLPTRKWFLSGTNIQIMDYMGTFELGLLYLSKPVQIEAGRYINITE